MAVITCRCRNNGLYQVIATMDREDVLVTKHKGRQIMVHAAAGTVAIDCRVCGVTQQVVMGMLPVEKARA